MLTSDFPFIPRPWSDITSPRLTVIFSFATRFCARLRSRGPRVIARVRLRCFAATIVARLRLWERAKWILRRVTNPAALHRAAIVIAMRHETRNTGRLRLCAPRHSLLRGRGNKSNSGEETRVSLSLAHFDCLWRQTDSQSIRFAWWCMKRIRRTRVVARRHSSGCGRAANVAHIKPFVIAVESRWRLSTPLLNNWTFNSENSDVLQRSIRIYCKWKKNSIFFLFPYIKFLNIKLWNCSLRRDIIRWLRRSWDEYIFLHCSAPVCSFLELALKKECASSKRGRSKPQSVWGGGGGYRWSYANLATRRSRFIFPLATSLFEIVIKWTWT